MPLEKKRIAIKVGRISSAEFIILDSEKRAQFTLFDLLDKHVRESVKETVRTEKDREYRGVTGGATWQEVEPGRFGANLITEAGLLKLTGARVAEGSPVNAKQFAASLPSPPTVTAIEHGTKGQWDVLLTDSAPIDQRDRALLELVACGEESISAYVLTELEKTGVKPDWSRRLIVAAEQLDLDDPLLRERLSKLLLDRASALLNEGQARNEQTIWSALRKYGTLVETTAVDGLLPFLSGKSSVATRQVTLQVIHEIYKQSPPASFEAVKGLTHRVAEIAEKFLDPDLTISPENGSLALNAFLTLAAMGNLNAIKLADRVKKLGSGFILRRSIRDLQELVSVWSSMTHRTDDQIAATKNVEATVAGLR